MLFAQFFVVYVLFEKLLFVFSDECIEIPYSGLLCTSKSYDPKDFVHSPTYVPIEITFSKLDGIVNLTTPKNFSKIKTENAIYKKFYITESCVKNIEERYFDNIDRNNKLLTEITFKSVTCLQKLSTKTFEGIGNYIKQLTFDSMPDLTEVEETFMDSFIVIERLIIMNTSIRRLPPRMLYRMPKLILLNITNNKLTDLLEIPFERKELVEKIHAYNNPFHCQCSLKPMVEAMKDVLSVDMYKCASPEKHKGKALINVDFCGQTMNTEEIEPKRTEKVVATAHVRIEIIIAVSVIILVLVIIVIVVVLYKRYTQKKKEIPVYKHMSPSKIIFQNESDSKQPFIFKYEA